MNQSENNFEQKAENTPNFQLRWLITERTFKRASRWCSSEIDIQTYLSEPVLQYSLDGITWKQVPTLYEHQEVK